MNHIHRIFVEKLGQSVSEVTLQYAKSYSNGPELKAIRQEGGVILSNWDVARLKTSTRL